MSGPGEGLSGRVEADDIGDPSTFDSERWAALTRGWLFPIGLFTEPREDQVAADEWAEWTEYEIRESDPSNVEFPWCEPTLTGTVDGSAKPLAVIVAALNAVPVLLAEVDRLRAERGPFHDADPDHIAEARSWAMVRSEPWPHILTARIDDLEAERAAAAPVVEAARRWFDACEAVKASGGAPTDVAEFESAAEALHAVHVAALDGLTEQPQPGPSDIATEAYEAKTRPPDWLLDDIKRGRDQIRGDRG